MVSSGNVERVVVIGAGECGARVAASLRERGFAGSITMIGEEAHAPYERPPLSKGALVAAELAAAFVLPVERQSELGIELVTGVRVASIDRHRRSVRLVDGREERFDRLVLATGARPRQLSIAGGELALTLRTLDDAAVLRERLVPGRRVVVIGAGFIGLEVAASARLLGCKVTVLEAAPRALARAVPAEVAEVLVKRHIDEGVEVICGVTPERVVAHHGEFAVDIAGYSKPFDADVVIAGVGATPNTELAADAGLACENGVAVDDRLRTSDPDIFAAGDCCSFPHPLFAGRRIRLESWRNAHDQAVVVAANITGGDEQHRTVPWFWSDQYELGLQLTGLADAARAWIVRDRPDGVSIRFGLDDFGRLVAACAVGPDTSVAKDIRIAELLIAASTRPDPAVLRNPSASLKLLLGH